MQLETLNLICIIWAGIAVLTFVVLQFINAPYGRHIKKGWGPEISNKTGWILMEIPSFLIILFFFLNSNQSHYAIMLSMLWMLHYFNRSFIFPFRIRTKGKKMPIVIMFSAIFFNCINAGLNGYYLSYFEAYSTQSFLNWNCYVGLFLFVIGFMVNQISDHKLINLRKPGEIGYKIPRGFLFDYISCPNHFGELLQWLGFAMLAWNIPAISFFIWTAANLIPRAMRHHTWYKNNFEEYPPKRKALIPKFW